MACLLIKIIGRKEKNVFKTFVNTKIIDFNYSKNNSKFTGSLLKIYVCDVSKTLLSMKVKYVYDIPNRKYTGGARIIIENR
jgi:hypothetical protein